VRCKRAHGQTLVEYAYLFIIIVILLMGSLRVIGGWTRGPYEDTSNALQGVNESS